jgi:hypothetical protein
LAAPFRDDEPSERANRSKRVEWVERWRDVIADEPELPGVWRRQGGGFHVRGRTIDPRSGRMREINWALPNLSKARDAFACLQGEPRGGEVKQALAKVARIATAGAKVIDIPCEAVRPGRDQSRVAERRHEAASERRDGPQAQRNADIAQHDPSDEDRGRRMRTAQVFDDPDDMHAEQQEPGALDVLATVIPRTGATIGGARW